MYKLKSIVAYFHFRCIAESCSPARAMYGPCWLNLYISFIYQRIANHGTGPDAKENNTMGSLVLLPFIDGEATSHLATL